MNVVKVHKVNFLERRPNAIHCLAYDETIQRLAVSRSDSSVEIWDLSQKSFLEKVIPSQGSVETVAWSRGRLFTAGLDGYITEHDLISLIPKRSIAIATNCSVWCLGVDKQNTFIAAGTEEGQICIYSIAKDLFDFEKKLVKQEGRILCLDWHKSGKIIVTGSIDTIRIWNVKSGQIVDRIIVGRAERRTETIVWCIAVTSDMTIVSGDSQGRVSFWNGNMGTLIASPQTHKADVLTLCLSKDENVVYASGVDPAVVLYSKAQIKSATDDEGKSVWMKSLHRFIHTHDVRSLVMAGDFLVSGGVDTNLVFSKYPPKTVHVYSPFAELSYVKTSPEASLVMMSHPNELELWRLGTTNAEAVSSGEHLPLSASPVKLLLLKSNKHESIICSAISKDGNWLAYSTLYQLKLFHLQKTDDENQIIVQKIKALPEKLKSALHMTFASDKLITTNSSGAIQLLDCNTSKCQLTESIESEMSEISLLEVSHDCSYLAVGTHKGEIRVYNMMTHQVHCHLPLYKCQVTAMRFDFKDQNLFAVYSDRKLIEFDIHEKAYSEWYREHNFNDFQDLCPYAVKGITLITNDENKIVLHDEESLYVIDRASSLEEPDKKRARAIEDLSLETEIKFKMIKKFKHLLDFNLLKNDEMIAVEITPQDVHSCLPPPLYRKKYGT